MGPGHCFYTFPPAINYCHTGPKIAALRKALRGKQLGGRGLAQLPAWSKCLHSWEVLGMFTPQGRGGVATAPGHLRALGGAGASSGLPQQP